MKARLWKQGRLQAQVTVSDETLRGDQYFILPPAPLAPPFLREMYRCTAVQRPNWSKDSEADFLYVREQE